MAHEHKPKVSITRAFNGPAYGAKPNPAAHGDRAIIQACRCGAARTLNVNGTHTERGKWRADD